MNILFPEVEVELSGVDGNAIIVMGTVIKAMKQSNIESEAIATFQMEAMSGDYDHLLQTVMTTVSVR